MRELRLSEVEAVSGGFLFFLNINLNVVINIVISIIKAINPIKPPITDPQ